MRISLATIPSPAQRLKARSAPMPHAQRSVSYPTLAFAILMLLRMQMPQCPSLVALYAIALAILLAWPRMRNYQPVTHARVPSRGPPAHLPGCGERRAVAVVACKAQVHGRRAAARRAGVLEHCTHFGPGPGAT